RAAQLPSPVAGLRGLSSDRPTRVGVGITRPIGGGLAAWLAHRPPWIVVVAGLVAVAALGYVDFPTGPEPTPPLLYLAPVALVAWDRRYRHAFSVVYIDLDEFKLVNFRLGHEAGDAVLRSVARGLTGVVRASDVVARIGGDQFVVLLPEAGAAAARLTAEKLRQALSAVVPAHGWRITASIGVATFLVPPESVDALLAAADRLMYQAKQTGKNTVAHETQNEAPALR